MSEREIDTTDDDASIVMLRGAEAMPDAREHQTTMQVTHRITCPRCGGTEPNQTTIGDDLPNEDMRRIGGNWVRRYGHMVQDDPDFVAAALYRVMRLARRDPKHFELSLLQERP